MLPRLSSTKVCYRPFHATTQLYYRVRFPLAAGRFAAGDAGGGGGDAVLVGDVTPRIRLDAQLLRSPAIVTFRPEYEKNLTGPRNNLHSTHLVHAQQGMCVISYRVWRDSKGPAALTHSTDTQVHAKVQVASACQAGAGGGARTSKSRSVTHVRSCDSTMPDRSILEKREERKRERKSEWTSASETVSDQLNVRASED
jgi:hypothetical protein